MCKEMGFFDIFLVFFHKFFRKNDWMLGDHFTNMFIIGMMLENHFVPWDMVF